jgi:hypothetical protein
MFDHSSLSSTICRRAVETVMPSSLVHQMFSVSLKLKIFGGTAARLESQLEITGHQQ